MAGFRKNELAKHILWMLATIIGAPAAAWCDTTLTAGSAAGSPGATVSVPVLLDGTDIECQGASFGLTHDDEVLTLDAIVFGADVEGFNGGSGPDFWVANTDPGEGIGGFVAFIPVLGDASITLPSEDDLELAVYEYTIAASASGGDVISIDFTEELASEAGGVPVAVTVVDNLSGVQLTLENGDVFVLAGGVTVLPPPGAVFVRGDVNGNDEITISDAVEILSYQFLDAQPPACLDAADVDDDGEISGLLEATALLNWIFNDGAPPPPPSECGDDPTSDDLDCAISPASCD